MFETELKYFIDHQEELVAEYADQVLVIRGEQVVDVCPDVLTAYVSAIEKYERGSFMIQPAVSGPSAYTVTIASCEVLAAR